jgi:hypothetical protein
VRKGWTVVDIRPHRAMPRVPGFEVLRRQRPVGARDRFTIATLRAAGIDANFADRPTLALERPVPIRRRGLIAVDVPDGICAAKGNRLTRAPYGRDIPAAIESVIGSPFSR